MTVRPDDPAIAAQILTLVSQRGPTSSICPTDVARALSDDWRPLLGPIRRVAAGLAAEGRLDILRKGKPIPPDAVKGVIRLRARPSSDHPTDTRPGDDR